MDYFISNEGNKRRFIIRLDKDDMLLESIEKVILDCNIDNAVVVSGIGTLSDARIHMITTTDYPAVEAYPEWHDVPIELCAVSGIIANGEPHLHIVFSDNKGTYSGHLEHGCRTLYLCELVIDEIGGDLSGKGMIEADVGRDGLLEALLELVMFLEILQSAVQEAFQIEPELDDGGEKLDGEGLLDMDAAVEIDGDDPSGIDIDIVDEVVHLLIESLSSIAVVIAIDGEGSPFAGERPQSIAVSPPLFRGKSLGTLVRDAVGKSILDDSGDGKNRHNVSFGKIHSVTSIAPTRL